jgi:hypothetical protein
MAGCGASRSGPRFATAYPVNWRLIRYGVKEIM